MQDWVLGDLFLSGELLTTREKDPNTSRDEMLMHARGGILSGGVGFIWLPYRGYLVLRTDICVISWYRCDMYQYWRRWESRATIHLWIRECKSGRVMIWHWYFQFLSGHGLVEHQGVWESGFEIYGGFPFTTVALMTPGTYKTRIFRTKWE